MAEKAKRDEIISWIEESIIRPRYRKPNHDGETIGELRIDPVGYEIFKQKCYTIEQSGTLNEMILTSLIVNFLLQATFGQGDTTAIDQKMRDQKDHLEFINKLEQTDPAKWDTMKKITPKLEQWMHDMPDRVRHGYKLYTYFCDNVVTKLLEERIRL